MLVYLLKVWDPDNPNVDPRRFEFADKSERDAKFREALKYGFRAECAVLQRDPVPAS